MNRSFIFIFIVIILTGIFVYTLRSTNTPSAITITPTPTPNESAPLPSVSPAIIDKQPVVDPDEVVHNFYTWYLKCSKSSGNCNLYSQKNVDAVKLSALIQKAKGYNAITCSQNTPSSIRIDHSVVDENGLVSVYVVETFSGGTEAQLIVDVDQQNNIPKIVNIACPRT